MSNYAPPTNPIAGPPGQPPGGFPPQQPWPQPPQKKSGALKWILIGCGGVVIIGTIVVVLLVWWGWNKAKQAGLDPELLQKRPAAAIAKMMVAADSDVELVSSDDSRGTLTIRDKKTGNVLTLDTEEADKGKIVFRGENGEEMTFDANAQGKGATIKMKSKEGTATLNAGDSAQLPSWLPAYPGAQVQANFSGQSAQGSGGTFGFTTDDSIERVTRFYEDALRNAGLKVETHSIQADGKVTVSSVTGKDESESREATMQIMGIEGKTQVTVVFGSKSR